MATEVTGQRDDRSRRARTDGRPAAPGNEAAAPARAPRSGQPSSVEPRSVEPRHGELRPDPPRRPTVAWRSRHAAGFVAGSVALAAAVTIAAGHLPPLVIGIGLAAALVGLGALTLPPRSAAPSDRGTGWRHAMPCHVSVQDRDLRIIETNQLFQRDFGDREGEHCYAVYKKSDAPCPACPVLRTFADGEVHTSEETVIARDGRRAHVVVTSAPVLDEHGAVSAVMEMSTDVTELKNLQRELEQSRRDFKRLFEAVPCHICVLDRDLRIIGANRLYQQDFDVTPGRRCFEVCKHAPEPCPDCLVAHTFEDGRIHSSEETLTTGDGRQLDLVVHSMPVRDDAGAITAVMEVFTDITEVKKLQRQLTLMGRAVAGMAHRIKNILMGLEGGIYVVNTGMQSDDRELLDEGWRMVETNVNKVSRLVKDLLYCSKERQPKFKDGVSPQEIARQVHELYAGRASDAGIDFELEIGEAPTRGTFDPDGLFNLLSNLIANAIDACRFDPDETKTAHTIFLRCHQETGDHTVFEVEDDGVGIPEDVSGKVFEDFFSTKGTEGTGIGLLVVQKVAEEHGGTVSFSTRQGTGTRFRVMLPPRRPGVGTGPAATGRGDEAAGDR
ncbi:MAG: PAS domain-containing protein [Candidatus Eiseniibacteriota bacterium]|jgi:PAS domain S-box-containing protein